MKGFRVWDTIEKKMYYDDFMIGNEGEIYQLHSYTNEGENYIVHMIPANISRYIVMKRSEYVDNLGMPIYELDLLQHDNITYKVVYSDAEGFRALDEKGMFTSLKNLTKCDCIGNELE